MIRCLAVDDEAPALAILADYISQVPFLTLVGTTTNPIEALTWVQQGRVDLVFLDIQMPKLTGLQFLKLSGNKCKVVLTTAYPEYALEGYENDVVDYLLKPISFERFLKAAQKVLALQPMAPPEPAPPPAAPIGAVPPPALAPAVGHMFVKGETKNKFLRVNYTDILYIEGLNNYVSIHLPTQRLVTYQTLRELAETLPQPPFLRVHKSFIVSLDKIRMVDGNTIYIQDKEIPVSETYRDQFYRLIREA
ncbi:response regulator transcription factor [Hymenobacter sp. BT186]|uniref:Response regulator transcription factor n=1 Tax=Hymenobacter telluris TaxID=2816474 RepID=A0A939JEX1_9BACT|nr:LytTR family DNA-binding domain-containing protein [Hymenobacter telluris]MBO0359832.1 response regulator transcription factor [Hymenobacter telluris]MBW3375859.1 LytTR family DNA-binding domain-containing protein [Hymenobacter norwichensis]